MDKSVFTACGSSSPATTVQPLQKGYVVDSPIAGLDYECGDIIGLTNNEGMFECRTFPITFKIGNLTIGTVAREAAMQHLKDNVEKLTSIMITPTTTTIELGKTAIFKAEGSFSNGAKRDISSEVTWSTSKPTVATMINKTVTAKTVGTTTIKATHKGKSKTATLTVTEASLIALDINATDTELAEGTETTLSATGTFGDDTTVDMTSQVTWSSSDITKATVATNGVGCVMNSIAPLIIPVGFVLAGIIAYIAHKRNWKIADFFSSLNL